MRPFVAAKMTAAQCHRTQFDPNGLFYIMPEDITPVMWGEEHYSRVACRVAAPDEETDLFAGLRD